MKNRILALAIFTSLSTALPGLAFAGNVPARGAEPAIAEPAAAAEVEDPFMKGAPVEAAIEEAEAMLKKQPKNMTLWVGLGNAYFDTGQAEKSIEAYAKALELDSAQPNVLCDQAVMYLKIGSVDKAQANFGKALAISPDHPQCTYNLGLLYVENLKDTEKGIALWEKYLQSDPDSPVAAAIREAIENLRNPPPAPPDAEEPGK